MPTGGMCYIGRLPVVGFGLFLWVWLSLLGCLRRSAPCLVARDSLRTVVRSCFLGPRLSLYRAVFFDVPYRLDVHLFMFKRDWIGWFGTAVPFKWISSLFLSECGFIMYERRMPGFFRGKPAVLFENIVFLDYVKFFRISQIVYWEINFLIEDFVFIGC